MSSERLTIACVSDLSGKVRGKGYPDMQREQRCSSGVGWTPANALITCFDTIAPGPYGSLGDLVLRPSRDAHVDVEYGAQSRLSFSLGNVSHTDGTRWECCLRSIAEEAAARLLGETGLRVLMAFEHEFVLEPGESTGGAYSLEGFVSQQPFAERLVGAVRAAGLKPDTFLREFGQHQYEITLEPAIGIAAADHAVILRELVRAVARAQGRRASFSPLLAPGGIGNGVHVHLSLVGSGDAPFMSDSTRPSGLSKVGASFVAGILKYIPGFLVLAAPSAVSYQRLVPHRWSAAYNNLGLRDREAAVRICATSAADEAARARQFNVEFRAADAAASPYIVQAALLHAGAQGIREQLPEPALTQEDISSWSEQKLTAHGLARLPQSLTAALEAFAADETVRSWFPPGFATVYQAHKRGEIALLRDRSEADVCAAYLQAY